ncbi:hypothetical protein CDIK_1405 [Cucumispora dikerogammari]|nr:hypothetical protein CDIK_1405 [Cucumispora dikerogammari]
MKSKKQKSQLTVDQKCEIIEYCHQYPDLKLTRIAEKFSWKFNIDISRRSIKNFIDNAETIKLSKCNNTKLISNVKNIKYKQLDKILKDCIETIESSGGFYTDKILQFKATEISSTLFNSEIDSDERDTEKV